MTVQSRHGMDEKMARAIAPGWERRRAAIEEICTPVRRWLVRELAAGPDDTVLELAAGAGDTGFEVAQMLGERGRLISSDLSPEMLGAARRRGAELGIERVEYRTIDAERIDLPDASVDAVLCRFGYMLMADPAAALRESRRVLREGGRLALAVFGPPERNPFFSAVAGLLTRGGHMAPPEPGGPGIFALASEQRLSALLADAGFGTVRTAEVPIRFTFDGIEEYLSFLADTAGPIAMALGRLSDEERDGLTPPLEQVLAPHATDRGYGLPGLSLVASAS